jgi:cell division protein FtsX
MLLGEPSIASIRQLAPAEVQAALSSVLPPSGTLPLPIVAEIIVQPGANRPAVQALLQQSFPTAELDDQAPMLDAVAQSVRLLQAFGGLIALGLGVVLGLFMALTIRAGLLAQHGTVALLIQLGATDGTLARTLAYQATLPVLVGTAIGSALAAVGLALGAAWQGLALGIGVWAMAFLPVVILPALALSIGAWVAWRLLHYA